MKTHLFAGAMLLCATALNACVKQPPPAVRAEATPTPAAVDEGVDLTAERMRRKTGEAAAAINDYLKANEPRLRQKFQKIGDKFTRDKDVWRQKLLQEKENLQPQIDQLKAKASQLDPKARAAIDQQTASLEQQSRAADEKLAELESATADGWKAFKSKLKDEDASTPVGPSTSIPDPTATP